MSKTGFVVRLTDTSWLAPWYGDPGRTLCLHNARVYTTEHGARTALGIAKARFGYYRSFSRARIVNLGNMIGGENE